MLTDRKLKVEINTATSGDNTLAAAPTKGHYEIDHIEIMPTGGAQTIKLKLAGASSAANQTPIEQIEYALDDNQAWVYDRTTDNAIEVKEATALILNLGAATRVTGFALLRVVGE